MTDHDVADLLSLTGHELRAPTGVLGGYLALLEKHAAKLAPDHQRALAGARRAQQRVLEILDEMRHVASIWHGTASGPATRTPIAAIASLLASGATDVVTEVSPDVASTPGDVPFTRDALFVVIDALLQAVVREHGGIVRCRVVWQPGHCEIEMTSTTPPDDSLPRPPFSRYRGGLGLTLIRAFALVEGVGGRIDTLGGDESPPGLRATVPWAPSV
jgi:hypothetical protein